MYNSIGPIYVCMYVCQTLSVCMSLCLCMYVCLYVCMYMYVYGGLCIWYMPMCLCVSLCVGLYIGLCIMCVCRAYICSSILLQEMSNYYVHVILFFKGDPMGA